MYDEHDLNFHGAHPQAVCLVVLILGGVALLWLGAIIRTLLVGEPIAPLMNVMVRSVGTTLASVMLAGVAFAASSSICREREQRTLDSLLTLPIDSDEIVYNKWLGSILCVRRLGWWLAGIWAAGVLTGGLHLLGLVLLVVAWSVYAAFFAALGLWFSVISRSQLQANLRTLVTGLAITVVGWLSWYFWYFSPQQGYLKTDGRFDGLLWSHWCPPVVLWELAFSIEEKWTNGIQEFLGILVGLLIYGGATGLLWLGISMRFGKEGR